MAQFSAFQQLSPLTLDQIQHYAKHVDVKYFPPRFLKKKQQSFGEVTACVYVAICLAFFIFPLLKGVRHGL